MKDLPPNVYRQSYLQKAGVRFNPNVVDTCVARGLSLSFYLVSALLILGAVLYFARFGKVFISSSYFYCTFLTLFLYELAYLIRYFAFSYIRKKLRIDNPPIAVEAYAIVLFDLQLSNSERLINPRKSAVLYKECGSAKPRFFTGPLRSKKNLKLNKDQLALVFIDRKNEKLYTVEDDKMYVTSSEKKKKRRYSISTVEAGVNKVTNQKI